MACSRCGGGHVGGNCQLADVHDQWSKQAGEFQPASNFGIGGGGLAREVQGADGGLVERIRVDSHPLFGDHLNVETILNSDGKKKAIIGNEHIGGFDWTKR